MYKKHIYARKMGHKTYIYKLWFLLKYGYLYIPRKFLVENGSGESGGEFNVLYYKKHELT